MRASWAAATACLALPWMWQSCEGQISSTPAAAGANAPATNSPAGNVPTSFQFNPHAALTGLWTDNAFGFHDRPLTEEVLDTLVGLGAIADTQRFHLNADVGYLYRTFLNGSVPNENLPSASVAASAAIVPERFIWSFEDRLGQISTESFESLAMADRQNANYLSTGPDAYTYLGSGSRNILRFSGRFGITDFGASNIDSDRYSGQVSLGRNITPTAILSVNYRYDRITYKQSDLYPAVRTGTEYLSYEVQSARTYFVVEGGVQKLDTENANSRNTPHALIGLQRKISPRVTVNVEVNHDFADVGELVRSSVGDPFQQGQTQNIQSAASEFIVDRANLVLIRSATRLTAAFEANFEHDRFEQPASDLDRKLYGGDLILSYILNPVWTAEAHGQWRTQEQRLGDPLQRYMTVSLGLTRRIGRGLQLALVYARSRGTGELASDDINENRVSIGLSWAPHGQQLAALGAVSQFRYYERSPGLAIPGQ